MIEKEIWCSSWIKLPCLSKLSLQPKQLLEFAGESRFIQIRLNKNWGWSKCFQNCFPISPVLFCMLYLEFGLLIFVLGFVCSDNEWAVCNSMSSPFAHTVSKVGMVGQSPDTHSSTQTSVCAKKKIKCFGKFSPHNVADIHRMQGFGAQLCISVWNSDFASVNLFKTNHNMSKTKNHVHVVYFVSTLQN